MKAIARPYVMTARAEAAAASKTRIVESAAALLAANSFNDTMFEAIAAGAGDHRRDVSRRFDRGGAFRLPTIVMPIPASIACSNNGGNCSP